MKKIFIISCLCVLSITAVKAQEIKFGAKAGANFATITGDDVEEADGRTALHLGGVVRIPISELFSLQPELVYSAQGWKFDLAGEDITYRLDYLNIPILADFEVAEGFSLQGGPQVGFNINSDAEYDGDTEDLEDVETLDLSVGIGAQYRLPFGLFFQARYMIGITDVGEEVDAKNSVIGLSAGYFFN